MTNSEFEDSAEAVDALASAISALRAATPKAEATRENTARLLEAFERRHRKPLSWPRLLIAAAVLVICASLLPRPAQRLTVAEQRLAALSARLAELDVEVAQWRERRAEAVETPTLEVTTSDPAVSAAIASVTDIVGPDPGFLRLLTAQRYETTDRAGAIERYRDLITDYAESPAASVARDRLAELAK